MAYSLTLKKMVDGDWSMGAGFTTTTDDVEAKLGSLRTDTDNLNVDISTWFKKSQGRPGVKAFVDAWVRWRDDTYKFIASWKQGFKIKLAWNYYDNAVDRLNELVKWRERWERLSGETSSAPASTVPKPTSAPDEVNYWKWGAMLGLGAVSALWVSSKVRG